MTRSDADPERASRVCLALMRLGTRLAAGFDRGFTEHNLTQAQFRVLIAAANLGGTAHATPSGLAEYLFVERASISVVLKPLLARRFLARHHGEDGRSYRVSLTEKGWDALRAIKPQAIAAADTAMAGLTNAQLRQLESLLGTLEDELRRVHGGGEARE